MELTALVRAVEVLHQDTSLGTLGRALDEVDTGLAVFGLDGDEVARNACLNELLDAELQRERLTACIRRQARLADGYEELELASRSYRLVGRRTGRGTLVLVDRLGSALPTTQELRISFGLRGREPQVALLAAEGLSNAAIAGRLRLSAHTVRHYLERVRERLGLHTRKALALHLMAGGPSRAAPDPAISPDAGEKTFTERTR